MLSINQIIEKTKDYEKNVGNLQKIKDRSLSKRLKELHKEMICFIGERYGQVLRKIRLLYVISEFDNFKAGGLDVSGWATIHCNAYFFNRTNYYDWMKVNRKISPSSDDKIISLFGHEIGHVVTPNEVLGAREYDKIPGQSYNHREGFADHFSQEFKLWVNEKKVENRSGYGISSLVLD